jgi:hypothetical protein
MWELSHTVLTNLATVLQMLQKDWTNFRIRKKCDFWQLV